MAKKSTHITVKDMYCGAGGSSLGVRNLAARYKGGLEVRVAMNHDPLAIASHNSNFPETRHICADIQNTNPRQVPSTDLLIASPECTKQTNAEGKKRGGQLQPELWGENAPTEAEVRSRTTMMSVPEYSEYHGYNIVIVENVVEARFWVGWRSWLQYMFDLGYQHQVLFFNSMFFHPTPQSRDRMYVVFHKKGNKKPDLEYRPIAPCEQCGRNVEALQWSKPGCSEKKKYKSQYLYVCSVCAKVVTPYFYAAMNAIDWSIPGERIGDRKRDLKPKTMDRIRFGLQKYGGRPLVVRTAMGSGVDCRVRELLGKPLDTQPGSNITALVHPYIIDGGLSYGKAGAQSAGDALTTQTTAQTKGVVSPFLVETKRSQAGSKRSRAADAPLATQSTEGNVGVVTAPYAVEMRNGHDKADRAMAVDVPLSTQTTQQSVGIVLPPPLLVSTNYFDEVVRPVDQPLNTQSTGQKMAIASPADFMVKLRGSGGDQLKKCSSGLDEPAGTMSAGGLHHGVVSSRAFISPFYNTVQANHVVHPMPTMATIAGHAIVDAPAEMPAVEDLHFRMLTSEEIGRAMAFPDNYTVLGNERERVRQYGNAVTPPVMEWIMERCIESLM